MQENQRRSVRYACILEAVVSGAGPCVYAPPLLVKLVNISTNGIGIHRDEPFEVGSLLTVKVLSQEGESVAERQARVVHATAQPNGTSIVGAALVEPFTEDEFLKLLAGLALSSRQ